LRWSDKATELFGWEEEEVLNDHTFINDFVYEEDFDLVWGSFKKLVKEQQESFSLINRNVTKSGGVVYSEWYNSILYDQSGRVVSIYSLVANVTDRVIAFKESEKSMQSYRDLFDSMSEAIYLLDHENNILIANKGVKSTYGYEPEEVVTQNQSMLRAPGKFDANEMEIIREIAEHQKAQKMEVWSKKANGEVFLTEMLVNKGSYFGQNVLIIIERDISDRKFAEEELLRREKFFSELFNTTPLAITMLNAHNEVELVNKGFEDLFGYELEEIIGLEIDRIIVPEEEVEEAIQLSNSPLVEEKQVHRKTKAGDLRDVIVYSVPVMIDDKVEAKFGLYVDITDRERSEETVRKSLKEKELLLAEVHHRVKNNLAVISGLLELQSYAVDDLKVNHVLNDSRLRIQSIALVHEKLYQSENLSEIDVDPYIRELMQSLQKSFKSNTTDITINFQIDPINLIITQAIPCGLLINEIVTNAYKHAFKDRDQGIVEIKFTKEKELLILSIKDNGVGLDNMNYAKPGPSLGMKLIRTISKQLKAETEMKSGEGAEFIFRFEKAYI
jgi:PAS domain S-box-containing protein